MIYRFLKWLGLVKPVTQVIFTGPIYNTEDFHRQVLEALRNIADSDLILKK